MSIARELGRILLVLFITVFLVAFLWQVPFFLTFVLLVPLGLSVWFWPEGSTGLSYVVGAIIGTLFTAWSFVDAVERPESLRFAFIWLPLVWGPAGVIVKRLELLVVSVWRKDRYKLPESP